MQPDLTVIIPTLNGAAGVDRCLCALAAQSIRPAFPIGFLDANFNVVFTDGSSEVFHR